MTRIGFYVTCRRPRLKKSKNTLLQKRLNKQKLPIPACRQTGKVGSFCFRQTLKQSASKKCFSRGERVRRPAAPYGNIPCLSWTRIAKGLVGHRTLTNSILRVKNAGLSHFLRRRWRLKRSPNGDFRTHSLLFYHGVAVLSRTRKVNFFRIWRWI